MSRVPDDILKYLWPGWTSSRSFSKPAFDLGDSSKKLRRSLIFIGPIRIEAFNSYRS